MSALTNHLPADLPLDKVLCSVVIPCYNAEKTIIETLESVLQQDYLGFDVIVIDDGSTDNTALKVWDFKERLNDAGIKLQLISQKNAGVSVARNRGVQESTSPYIAFLDADDRWAKDKLTHHLQHLEANPEIAISFARCRVVDKNGKTTQHVSSLPMNRQQLSSVFSENPTTTTSNLVVRRSVFNQVGGFNETMSFAEDQEFIVRVISQTDFQVTGIDKVLVDYLTSEDGLSSELSNMYQGWLKMVAAVKAYEPEFVEQHFKQAEAQYCRYLARRNLRLGADPRLGWQFSKQAIRADWREMLRQPKRTVPVHALNFLRAVLPTRKSPSIAMT